jgi:hypothetical protein
MKGVHSQVDEEEDEDEKLSGRKRGAGVAWIYVKIYSPHRARGLALPEVALLQ